VALLGGGARNFVLGKKVMDNSNYDKPVCLECGDKIKGRSDKKFCNDACRSAHHNKKNKVASNPQKTINNLLSKNRRILKDCFEQSEHNTVPIIKLENKGFVFNFYTHLIDSNKGQSYRYCYDFGYSPGSNGEVHIAKYPGTYL
jgi:hypothetical protein